MNKQNKKAFTLVELIVVITIITILGTIAFISLQGYNKSARDSKRISDIQNIKKSLELFSLNTGEYPLPDNGYEALYSGSTIWTQGIVGNNVTANLSKNLQSKPLDPITESEYTYSVTYFKDEYELYSFYESDIITYKNLLNGTLAADNIYPKIDGTYNGIYVETDEYIVPTPSIINSEMMGTSITLDGTNIQSQIITGGDNLFAAGTTSSTTGELDMNFAVYEGTITSESGTGEMIDLANTLQNAYTGTVLSSEELYEPILSVITDEEKIALVGETVLHEIPTIFTQVSSIKDVTDCENPGDVIYGTLDGTDTDLTCDDDTIVCSGSGTGYTIAACNIGQTNINGYLLCIDSSTCTTDNVGQYFQWGRNKGFMHDDNSQEPNQIDGSIGLNALSDTYGFVWSGSLSYPATWANTDISNNWGNISNNSIARQGPCKEGYHIPSIIEWDGLISSGGWLNTEGYNIISDLKIPKAGNRNRYTTGRGYISNAILHSSVPSGTRGQSKFFNSGISTTGMDQAFGNNIRCFKN